MYNHHLTPRTTQDASNSRISKADLLIHHHDLKYLIDFNVTGVTQDNVADAIATVGVLTKSGEERKLLEVNHRYTTPPNTTFLPFVLDVTGSFGDHALTLIKRLVQSIPLPADEADVAAPAAVPDPRGQVPYLVDTVDTFRARIVSRFKEVVSAAVHRGNASTLASYMSKVRAHYSSLEPAR
jgi:hypothetical protein